MKTGHLDHLPAYYSLNLSPSSSASSPFSSDVGPFSLSTLSTIEPDQIFTEPLPIECPSPLSISVLLDHHHQTGHLHLTHLTILLTTSLMLESSLE